MKDIKKLFGLKIKEIRKKKLMTQAQLAEMVSVDDKHISCIESGKNFPSAILISKLAEALGVEPKDLFEFYYLDEPDNLTEDIIKMLNNLNEEELRLTHKYIRTFILK
ncbi:TPA: helix-turn-helix transcriptional regulator [Candidatus Avigastranaerophilus faecigallinarum]|nr:helix-turn-helix transcriptional regulator [Candidatus Avigastranaerophilus faecigallinarum]